MTDISEVRRARKNLEEKLSSLIAEFEQQHEVVVTDISVSERHEAVGSSNITKLFKPHVKVGVWL